MTWENKPGSREAVLSGCRCPISDNNNGAGRNGLFITNGDCPMHGVRLADERSHHALVWVILGALASVIGSVLAIVLVL